MSLFSFSFVFLVGRAADVPGPARADLEAMIRAASEGVLNQLKASSSSSSAPTPKAKGRKRTRTASDAPSASDVVPQVSKARVFAKRPIKSSPIKSSPVS